MKLYPQALRRSDIGLSCMWTAVTRRVCKSVSTPKARHGDRLCDMRLQKMTDRNYE